MENELNIDTVLGHEFYYFLKTNKEKYTIKNILPEFILMKELKKKKKANKIYIDFTLVDTQGLLIPIELKGNSIGEKGMWENSWKLSYKGNITNIKNDLKKLTSDFDAKYCMWIIDGDIELISKKRIFIYFLLTDEANAVENLHNIYDKTRKLDENFPNHNINLINPEPHPVKISNKGKIKKDTNGTKKNSYPLFLSVMGVVVEQNDDLDLDIKLDIAKDRFTKKQFLDLLVNYGIEINDLKTKNKKQILNVILKKVPTLNDPLDINTSFMRTNWIVK
jgi:hypothetical protein